MFPAARTQDVEAEQLKLELRLALLEGQEQAQDTFIGFSRYVWPEAIISSHHELMAKAFDRIADGTLKRLIVNMPPRPIYSLLTSWGVSLRPRSFRLRTPASSLSGSVVRCVTSWTSISTRKYFLALP